MRDGLVVLKRSDEERAAAAAVAEPPPPSPPPQATPPATPPPPTRFVSPWLLAPSAMPPLAVVGGGGGAAAAAPGAMGRARHLPGPLAREQATQAAKIQRLLAARAHATQRQRSGTPAASSRHNSSSSLQDLVTKGVGARRPSDGGLPDLQPRA